MKGILLGLVFALGLGLLTGCSNNNGGGGATVTPAVADDSAADKNPPKGQIKGGGRFPKGPGQK